MDTTIEFKIQNTYIFHMNSWGCISYWLQSMQVQHEYKYRVGIDFLSTIHDFISKGNYHKLLKILDVKVLQPLEKWYVYSF